MVSPRVELARAALAAATADDAVVAGNPGDRGVYVTQDGATKLAGVVAVAEPGGRYSVDLYLTVRLVPFHELGDRVSERVRAHAAAAGLGDRLGALHVTVVDVVESGVVS